MTNSNKYTKRSSNSNNCSNQKNDRVSTAIKLRTQNWSRGKPEIVQDCQSSVMWDNDQVYKLYHCLHEKSVKCKQQHHLLQEV